MNVRLSLREKVLYGVADYGGNLVGVVVNTWLLYYLINVARLPPLAAGLAFLVGRLFDAFVDPHIGALSDRWRIRRGRLWFVRIFAGPASLMFALLWFVPYAPEGARLGLATLGFMLLSALHSLAVIPYLALGPELTSDYDERTSMNSVKLTFSMLATLTGVALPPLIILGVTGAQDLAASPARGWIVIGVVSALMILVTLSVTAFGLRERPRKPVLVAAQSLSIRAAREVLGTFGFAPLLGLFWVTALALTLTTSLLPFYLESVLRLPGMLQSPLLGGLFLVAMASFPLWVAVSARIGKVHSVIAGLLLLILSLLSLAYLVPRGSVTPALLITFCLNGLGLASVLLFPWAMLPDVIEFDEWRSGQRREGLIYALLVMGLKAAGSVGVFSNALVTSLVGYQAGQAQQSVQTVAGLQLMGPMAAGLFALAIVFAWRYPITRANHTQVRQQLAAATLSAPAFSTD